jgi:hypothetical protein
MTKKQKLVMERAFVDLSIFVGMRARLAGENENWAALFMAVMAKDREELVRVGMSEGEVREALKTVAGWLRERVYSIQIYVSEPGGVPDFEVTFVDELEKNPDYLAMKEALSRPGKS